MGTMIGRCRPARRLSARIRAWALRTLFLACALLPAASAQTAPAAAQASPVPAATPAPPRPGDLPIEIVSTWTAYNYIGSSWKESVLAKTVVERYSPEGLLLSSRLSLLVGGVHEKTDYLYSQGRLLKATVRDGSGALKRSTSYEYGESGGRKLRKALTLTAEGATAIAERQYLDAKGRVVEIEVLDASGSAYLERRIEYDGRGRPEKEYAAAVGGSSAAGGNSAAEGSLAWAKECKYGKDDPAGNWLTRVDWESYRGSWPHQRYIVRRVLKYANPVPGAKE